jgi:hypothetical protein
MISTLVLDTSLNPGKAIVVCTLSVDDWYVVCIEETSDIVRNPQQLIHVVQLVSSLMIKYHLCKPIPGRCLYRVNVWMEVPFMQTLHTRLYRGKVWIEVPFMQTVLQKLYSRPAQMTVTFWNEYKCYNIAVRLHDWYVICIKGQHVWYCAQPTTTHHRCIICVSFKIKYSLCRPYRYRGKVWYCAQPTTTNHRCTICVSFMMKYSRPKYNIIW